MAAGFVDIYRKLRGWMSSGAAPVADADVGFTDINHLMFGWKSAFTDIASASDQVIVIPERSKVIKITR